MPTQTTSRILLIEDSPSLARLYQEYLANQPFDVIHCDDGKSALAMMGSTTFDAVLLDLKLPDMSGMDILATMREREISTAVIVITAHGSVSIAVDAMRAGAADFVMKPFNGDRLVITLNNALERQQLRRVVETLQHDFGRDEFERFVGRSLPMQSVYRIIENVGPSKATVFITGESGTGKELCAEAIHRHSPREKGAFITLNCAAIPKDLMESEIFGHVKGAFTGAISDREGAAALANGGTLFLDEICEMDLRLQSKLLRFIQTGTVQQVGGSSAREVDVRFICATNRDPLQAVERGEFREDLYYRLHVVPIHMPPLRDRGDDVLLIAQNLLDQFTREEGKSFVGFSAEVDEALRKFDWPGNVRQLQNVLRNIIVLNDQNEITLDLLPPTINQNESEPEIQTQSERFAGDAQHSSNVATPAPSPFATIASEIRPLWIQEKEIIEGAIALCNGNIPKAAALLEISASTIYRKRQTWAQMEKETLPAE